MTKVEDTSHLRLRIDPIRLAKLQKNAEKNGRTLTGEIIHRLDESFRREGNRRIESLLADWNNSEEKLHALAKLIGDNVLRLHLKPREGDEK